MAIGTLFGSSTESSGLYGIATGSAVNPTVVSQTYFEWFIFITTASTPATPTGGSWNFTSNIGVPPAGWSNFISGVPLNNLWFSTAFVDSRNPTVINWSTPGLISSQSVYATAYADVFTGNGSTVAWTLTQDPVAVNNTDVSINGVTQVPTTDYTVSGTTLTTTTAAPLNAVILVKYRQALPLSYYGAASNVQFTPVSTLTATNVQAAIAEILTDYALQTGAASIGFAPVGALTSTNVQAAIAEVVTDLALSSGSSTVGYLPSGTGAIATTVQTKLRETVSVLDFGVNTVPGTTDMTAAFDAAIATGKTVFVPVGDYKVINITVTSGMKIVGEKGGGTAAGGARLLVGQNGAAAFLKTTSNVTYDVQISDIQILAASGVTNAKGYYQTDKSVYTAYCLFNNVETWRNLEISYDGYFIFGSWNDCRDAFYGSAVGSQTHQAVNCNPATYGQTNQTNLNKFESCQFFNSDNANGAIDASYGYNWSFIHCDFESNTTRAARLRGIEGILFQSCWFEQLTSTECVALTTSPAPNAQGCRGVNFDNCYFYLGNTTVSAINAGGSVRWGITNSVFVQVPAAVVLAAGANLNPSIAFKGNIALSGAGSSTFFTGFYSTTSNTVLDTTTISSPNMANINVLPIGPGGLGAASFTLSTAGTPTPTKTNVTSLIGLTGNAVQILMTNVETYMYYTIPSKIKDTLASKTVTFWLSGYGVTASTSDGLRAAIWVDVVPTGVSNATAISGSTTSTGALNVGTTSFGRSYVTYTFPSSVSSVYVGFSVGGVNANLTMNIETMAVYLGSYTPDLTPLH
jgi:hypothetical protein